MIFQIYLFLLTFKIVGSAINSFLAYKVARMKVTPTLTYGLFAFGFALRTFVYIEALLYTQSYFGFLGNFSSGFTFFNQAVEVLIVSVFMTGFAKKYGYLKRTFPNHGIT